MFSSEDHLINPAGISSAMRAVNALRGAEKRAFVPGGDPSMGGAPPGGDPAAAGGPPPGGDPGAGAGAPPPPGGGDGGLMQMITGMQQQIQQMQQGMGGGMQGGGGAGAKNPLAPKIDEKAVLSQILKLLARIVDHLKIPIPASEMVINTADQVALAQASQQGGAMPGIDPTAQAAGGGPGQPMPGTGAPGGMPIGPEKMGRDGRAREGFAFDTTGLSGVRDRAASIARIQRLRKAG